MRPGVLNAVRQAIAADLRIYLAEVRRIPDQSDTSRWQLLKDFLVWRASLADARNPIDDERPWLTFGAIDRVGQLVGRGSTVFEYGAGGSTLYFLRKEASVITVEHNPEWLERVAAVVRRKGYGGWRPLAVPPAALPGMEGAAPEDPHGYVSSDKDLHGLSFEKYAASIDAHQDGSFDLVVLDGRARPSCGKHAHPKVKPGGHLVLDNAERTLYAWVHRELAGRGWSAEHYFGPGPYNRGFWQTSIYARPPEAG